MKALILHRFGGPEALTYEEVETPPLGPKDICVDVRAVSVNPGLDFLVREGRYVRPVALPHILGIDPAGVVVETGEEVETPKPGDRVWLSYLIGCGECEHCRAGRKVACASNKMVGVSRWGGYAQRIVIPAENAVPVPDAVDFPEAVVLARHYPTAMFLLEDQARLQAGEWVLVNGAAGGLGLACVQIARAAGARVIAGAGRDERVELALSHGAGHGINYRSEDIGERLMEITGGAGIAVLCDSVGDAEIWPKALNCVAKNGRVVTAGARGGGKVELNLALLYTKRISILGGVGTAKNGAARAFDMAARGELEPVIARIMPLREGAEAHRLIASGEVHGKIVLRPDME